MVRCSILFSLEEQLAALAFELSEFRSIDHLFKPGFAFVDIGANCGFFALRGANVLAGSRRGREPGATAAIQVDAEDFENAVLALPSRTPQSRFRSGSSLPSRWCGAWEPDWRVCVSARCDRERTRTRRGNVILTPFPPLPPPPRTAL